jgi:serine/threonine-protein kinase
MKEEPDESERPVWPWLVAGLFVVAAAIAGVLVFHQLSGSGPQETVGLYTGEPVSRAVRQIRADHLVANIKHGTSATYPPGRVYDQSPQPGGHVTKGGAVTIWVSSGKPKVAIPKLAGLTWPDASKALRGLGLKPVEQIVPGGTTKGMVTGSNPGAGQKVTLGSRVTVNVTAGPKISPVPTVVGQTLAQATAALHAAGFNVNPTYVDSTAPANQVISQNPAPSTPEPAGTIVNVQVSNGPPQKQVPDVVGETAQQAVSDLQAAGFKVKQVAQATSDVTQQGIVVAQTPAGNSQAGTGSTVTIYVGQFSGTTTGP